MARSLAAMGIFLAGLAACGAGCTTCQSYNDYCGPVYNGGCEPCIMNQRVGSNFDNPGVGPIPNTSPLVPGRRGPAGAGGTYVPPLDQPLPELDENLPPPPSPPSAPSMPPSARMGPNLRR